jgi:hypothetical protein
MYTFDIYVFNKSYDMYIRCIKMHNNNIIWYVCTQYITRDEMGMRCT